MPIEIVIAIGLGAAIAIFSTSDGSWLGFGKKKDKSDDSNSAHEAHDGADTREANDGKA